MSSHDEFSSDEEDFEDKQVSEVFLGFVDAPIVSDEEDPEDNDIPTIEDTFIGGKPIWFHPKSKPKESQLKCDSCGNLMSLLLQAFAPLDEHLYDRVIYIFACKNTAQCSKKKGTVKCLRAIDKDPNKISKLKSEQETLARIDLDEKLKLDNKKKIQFESTKDLFTNKGSNENVFSSGSNPFASPSSNPFTNSDNPISQPETSSKQSESKRTQDSYASVAAKNLEEKIFAGAKSVVDDSLPSYPGYFLFVEQEKFKKTTTEAELEKYKHLMDNEIEIEGDKSKLETGISSSGLDPQISKISGMLDDKHFEAFSKTVEHNPAQVLRYNLGGKPLLYSGKDSVASKFSSSEGPFNIPRPAYNPSSSRRFELQLMPKAILDLESKKNTDVSINDILNGMSWGTIIVCTDVEDYIPEEFFDENHVAYIEEWCAVQWEESV